MGEKAPEQGPDRGPANTGWVGRLTSLLGLKPQQANMVKLMAVGVALGVLFLNAGDLFGIVGSSKQSPSATEVSAPPGAPQDELTRMEDDLAKHLERALSVIQGAGTVRVTVMLEAGPTVMAIADTKVDKTTTHETASDKSNRETTTTNTSTSNVIVKSGNADALAVAKKSRAQIAGVLIVADGARSGAVRARLHASAVTALGISANRIAVVAANGR